MEKRGIWVLLISLSIIIALVIIAVSALIIIRNISTKQLDDVSPLIQCDEDLLEKANVYYVIPKFNNKSISENKTWCSYILSLNKTLGMHGVYHTYNEFLEQRDEAYFQEGLSLFKDCFGFYPEIFEPPQMEISGDNKALVKDKVKLQLRMHNLLHKVYHCNDTGKFSNKFVDLF